MKIKVLAFGIVKDIFSGSSVDLEVPDDVTAAGLKAVLVRQYPRLQELASCLMAVNNEYADAKMPIREKDEIAMIPPVSGG